MKNHKIAYNKLKSLLTSLEESAARSAEKAVERTVDPAQWSRYATHAKAITVNGQEVIMTW